MDLLPTIPPDPSALETPPSMAALLDALPWGVLALNAQGIIQHVNQQAAYWCGTPAESLLGQPLTETPLPEALAATLLQVSEPGAETLHEIWLPHTKQWISLRPAPAPAGYRWVFWENITPRKQAEAAQQRSHQLLLDLEEVARTGSYDIDLGSGSFYFSDGMYRLFGEAPQAFVPTLEFIDSRSHPADANVVRQVLDEAVRTRQPYTYRRRIRRTDGQWRTLEAHGEVRCDATGNAVQLRGLVQDITERMQAEQELHANRELLRATIDSSLDMVQVFEAVRNEQGDVIDFSWVLNNTTAEQAYGNVIGQRLCALNPGVVETGIFDTFKRVLETGVPDQSERHYVHEQFDGWFFQSTVKLGDGVTTTTHDITSRKQAEQELSETKAFLQATLDSSRYAVQAFKAVRDANGKIVDFTWALTNKAWQEGYGGAMTGKSVLQENPGVVETGLFDLFVQVTETGVPVDHEQYYAHEQFEGWFHQTLVRMGDGFVMNTTDITERKKNQEEILRLKDELAQRALDRYRILFETIDEGFCVMELVLDDHGQVTDIIYREANAAFEQHAGFDDVINKRASEIFPRIEPHWVNSLTRVQQTGVPERIEGYNADTNRWFTLQYSRIGDAGSPFVAAVFNNITERKQHEQRQEFLLNLSDALRAEPDADAVANHALRLLCEQLRLDRCYIAEYRLEADRADFTHQVGNDRVPPLPNGGIRLSDFPEAFRVVFDRTLVINDFSDAEGLSDTDRQNIGALGLRALVAATLRQGEHQPHWVLVAVSAVPRHWNPAEIVLLEEVTERTWAAMERARAEDALRQSEQRQRTLVANLPGAAVFVVGPDLRYQLAEGEALATAGLRPADLLGRTVAEAMPPELVPQYEAHYRQALGGQGFSLEHTAHGRTFISRGVPLPGPGNQPEAVLVVSFDITRRKQAEAALRQVEERYREQLEQQVMERTQQLQDSRDLLQSVLDTSLISMSVLYAVRDEGGQVQDFRLRLVNKELERETGRTDLVGKLYAQEYPGIRQIGIFNLMLQALDTNEPQSMEYFYEHEGFSRWFACQFVKLGDGVVATNLDITARKTAEEERFRNLQLLEQAEAVAGLGSWDYDLTTGTMRWSDGMYQLLGLPLGVAVGADIYLQFVVEQDRARAEQLVHHLTTGTSFEETLRLRVGEQVKTVRLKAVVLRNEAGQATRVLGVDLDISELQRLEADNLRLRLTRQQTLFEAVQAAQEVERRRIAESLHNGVGQILYATKLRLDQLHLPLPGTAPAVVAARREAAQLLSEAIRQTRVLSHELVPTVLEEFGLEAALQDISRKMSTPQLRLRSHILLDNDAAPLTPMLQMALYRMAQELALNIVNHARGATEASLELETMPGWVLLRAEDNGPGFAADLAASTGLGLRSIRNRVALLGGELEIGSASTSGAYVRIRIPLSFPTPS